MDVEIYAPTREAGMCLILKSTGSNPYELLQVGDSVTYPDWTTKHGPSHEPEIRWGIVESRQLSIRKDVPPIMAIIIMPDPNGEFTFDTLEEFQLEREEETRG